MIKIDKGSVYIEGNGRLLCFELEELLRQFRKAIASAVGEDASEMLISEILENSKRPDEDATPDKDDAQPAGGNLVEFENFIRGVQDE